MIKSVCGYEGLYEVDEHGNVYSTRNKRKLKPILMESGYEYVHLCNGKNNTILKRVHRIVAEAFIPNPMNYEQVNHKDGNKTNNCVGNLEWVTHGENTRHAYKIGLCRSIKSPFRRLSDEQIEFIRSHYVVGDKDFGGRALGRKFCIDHEVIRRILSGRTYKK